jgi:YfiR/HmsC-like
MIMTEHESSLPPQRGLCGRAAAWLCALVIFLPVPTLRMDAQARPSQYDVEAAYLLNIGKFMHLSAQSRALRRTSFDICILGRDPLGKTLSELAANDSIDGHAARIVHSRDPLNASTCAIAFISAQDNVSIRDELSALAGSDVLTVGDAPDFLRDGGMIQFVLEKDHVRFAVNLNAVEKTHLVLSSELLRVALYVKGKPQTEGLP